MKWILLLVFAAAAFLVSQGFTPSSPAREYIYFRGKMVAMEGVASQSPAPGDYSPPNNSFSGTGGVFKIRSSDPNGALNLYQTNVMLGAGLDPATSCFLFYQYQYGNVYLYDPATAAWSGAMSIAAGNTSAPTQLDSSLCTIYKTNSGAAILPSQPTVYELSLNVTLKPTLPNPVNVWAWEGDLQSNYAWWSILPPQPYTRFP